MTRQTQRAAHTGHHTRPGRDGTNLVSCLAYVFALAQAEAQTKAASGYARLECLPIPSRLAWTLAQKLSVWLSHAICTCRMSNGPRRGLWLRHRLGLCVDYLSSTPHHRTRLSFALSSSNTNNCNNSNCNRACRGADARCQIPFIGL